MIARRLAVLVLAATSVLALSAVPASASTSRPQSQGSIIPMTTCVPQIGVTHRSHNWIVGYGSLSNCGPGAGTATLYIQRSRWYGWETMASATVTGPGYDQYVSYNCTNTGTHDFRTLIQDDQTGQWKLSNTLSSVTC